MLDRKWRKGNPLTLLVGMQTSTATMENSVFPQTTKNQATIPAIPPLSIFPKKVKTVQRDTRTPVFTAVVFTIAERWKQPRCPSADEWIRKLWYIYTKKYYSAIKKNTFKSVLMRWMKVEPIIQSEVSQKEKHQYSILTHIYGI